jgi:beta-glucosidase
MATLEYLLDQMNLDEKLAQLGSVWGYELQDGQVFSPEKAGCRIKDGIGEISRPAGGSSLEPCAAAAFNNSLQRYLQKHTRLGIPAIIHEECCLGYLGLGGTAFPQMLGLACTFEPALASQMTREIRQQLRSVGAHQGLAPVLDVGRDPRWGRIEETFGEDPLLVSQFGTAYIAGLQGDSLSDGGVMATGKHFVGHSLSQGGQNCAPVRMGADDLWNVYLLPFQAAFNQANLQSIMNAYPELDGEVVAASSRLLTGLLRARLGFQGLVVSDYEAIPMIHTYLRMAENKCQAAALALSAGIDLELPTRDCYAGPLLQALERGDINLEYVDTAVLRTLKKKMELGLFENPYVDESRVPEFFETREQRDLALDIARKSMVLLKNDGALPLSPRPCTIAVIGPNTDDPYCLLGGYSYPSMLELMTSQVQAGGPPVENFDREHIAAHSVQIPTIFSALKSIAPEVAFTYAKGCDRLISDSSGFDLALHLARQADAVILVLGDQSGLTPNCTVGETRDSADLTLPGLQEQLAEAVIAVGKPVIAVLVTGRPYAIPLLVEKANAILEAWLPGEEGAAAIAETIFGYNNPGGKLAITFPRHVGQTPIFYDQKPSGGKSNWYTDYVNVKSSPLYPFGHGLSYTSFEFSQFSLSQTQASAGETIDIQVKIANTGQHPGDEVIQLYVQDEYASMPRPVKELKGYIRLALHPSEQKTVTFHLPVNLLAYHDQNQQLVLESGSFKIMLGSSSEDIRCEGTLLVSGDRKSHIVKQLFQCPVAVA